VLGNVAAHTPDGSTATLTAARQDGQVIVEIGDDGPGVPADQLSRIFDRFYRAGAPSRRPGSGLGLAIVAAVAAAHDGTVAARAEPHGLRITLTLPARTQSPVPSTAASSANGHQGQRHSNGRVGQPRAADDLAREQTGIP
jgi:two-component system, OmpR family, sensor kinase